MKFAVLASNSFTGSHFIDHVLRTTEAEVLGISRSPEYNSIFLPYRYRKEHVNRFQFHQGDVVKGYEEIVDILNRYQPDYVVNFAAQGEVRNSWNWPEEWYRTNCLGVVHLSQGLLDKPYLKRYVAASTPEVYGSTTVRMTESFEFKPSTPYAASKLAGDLHLMALFQRYGFPACFTRSANVYGIHQQLYRIIPRTIIFHKLGKQFDLHGGGKALRSFIHARDVAEATLRVCFRGENGEAYHIAPPDDPISIREVVRLTCELLGVAVDEVARSVGENFGQDSVFSLNAEKIASTLQWEPQVSLESGIQETIDWIEKEWKTIASCEQDYVHIHS